MASRLAMRMMTPSTATNLFLNISSLLLSRTFSENCWRRIGNPPYTDRRIGNPPYTGWRIGNPPYTGWRIGNPPYVVRGIFRMNSLVFVVCE
jgi:hypothetical protein